MTGQKRTASPSKASTRVVDEPLVQRVEARPALRPRPVLFVVLLVATLIWLVALVVMRFTTVNPPPIPHLPPAPVLGR